MPDHGLRSDELAIIRTVLAPYAGDIERVALFGSRATGTARPNSDIDLVLYGLNDQAKLDRIYTLFSESLLSVTVDVQAYELIDYPPLRKHIDECMKPLFTRHELLNEAQAIHRKTNAQSSDS